MFLRSELLRFHHWEGPPWDRRRAPGGLRNGGSVATLSLCTPALPTDPHLLRLDVGCFEWDAHGSLGEMEELFELLVTCQPLDFEADIAAWPAFEFQG